MKYKSFVQSRYSEFKFDGKPDEAIRSCLKRNGYRWNPASGVWWAAKATGYADVCAAIDKLIHKASGAPDGVCHRCQSPQGFWRSFAARTMLQCAECWHKTLQELEPQSQFIDVDRMHEDDCARACGL